jgi:hypothetical protein
MQGRNVGDLRIERASAARHAAEKEEAGAEPGSPARGARTVKRRHAQWAYDDAVLAAAKELGMTETLQNRAARLSRRGAALSAERADRQRHPRETAHDRAARSRDEAIIRDELGEGETGR